MARYLLLCREYWVLPILHFSKRECAVYLSSPWAEMVVGEGGITNWPFCSQTEHIGAASRSMEGCAALEKPWALA